jgi:hypothetical protein
LAVGSDGAERRPSPVAMNYLCTTANSRKFDLALSGRSREIVKEQFARSPPEGLGEELGSPTEQSQAGWCRLCAFTPLDKPIDNPTADVVRFIYSVQRSVLYSYEKGAASGGKGWKSPCGPPRAVAWGLRRCRDI